MYKIMHAHNNIVCTKICDIAIYSRWCCGRVDILWLIVRSVPFTVTEEMLYRQDKIWLDFVPCWKVLSFRPLKAFVRKNDSMDQNSRGTMVNAWSHFEREGVRWSWKKLVTVTSSCTSTRKGEVWERWKGFSKKYQDLFGTSQSLIRMVMAIYPCSSHVLLLVNS